MKHFQSEDEIIRVYGCATMWHENSEEMAEMLKSIFRMDEDHSARFSFNRFSHQKLSLFFKLLM
jgi:hypothetical protein